MQQLDLDNAIFSVPQMFRMGLGIQNTLQVQHMSIQAFCVSQCDIQTPQHFLCLYEITSGVGIGRQGAQLIAPRRKGRAVHNAKSSVRVSYEASGLGIKQ